MQTRRPDISTEQDERPDFRSDAACASAAGRAETSEPYPTTSSAKKPSDEPGRLVLTGLARLLGRQAARAWGEREDE